ncbi:MAG: hypothetical protein FWD36_02285 [Treponema sp.]|nr:hypothetical protein [Treponema sp.]
MAIIFLLMGTFFFAIGISDWDKGESNRFALVGVGGLFILVGILTIAEGVRQILRKRLVTTGRLVRAKITGIAEQKWISKGRTHIDYKLKAEHNGMVFLSEIITKDDIRQTEKYETVNVYIDNNNAKKYYVDLKSVVKEETKKDPMKNPLITVAPMLLLVGITSTGFAVFMGGAGIMGKVDYEGSLMVLVIICAVFAAIGLLMTAAAITVMAKQTNKKKMQQQARHTGRLVKANITGIVEDVNVRIRRRHPRLLEAEYDGRIFHSEYLKEKEIENIQLDKETVDVYINREHKDVYYIDLESIKKEY